MATQQEYLDDLERHGMVRVTTNEQGEKVYSAPDIIPAPPYNPMAYFPNMMLPEQWRDSVLQNFTDVYLKWWTDAFLALQAQLTGQKFEPTGPKPTLPVFNKDTGLWEQKEA